MNSLSMPPEASHPSQTLTGMRHPRHCIYHILHKVRYKTYHVIFGGDLIGPTQCNELHKDRILVYPYLALQSLCCVACGLR